MNAPTRQQGLDTALNEAFDPSLPEAEFAERLGRLAAALTDAEGMIVVDEAGDILSQSGVGSEKLKDLCAAARVSEDGGARSERRLALMAPSGSANICLGVQVPVGGRALALTWERLLFLKKLAAQRANISSSPFEADLLGDIRELALGDWRSAQPFIDKLRRVAGVEDIALGQLDGDVVGKIVIAGQPGLVAAAPAQDTARARLDAAIARGDVLGQGAVRYAMDLGEIPPDGLIEGLQGLFTLPRRRTRRGWLRRARAPALFALVIGAIALIPVPDHAELPASVVATDQRELVAPVTAVLVELAGEEGDQVAKGDIVARFDDADLQLEASSERANLAAALTKIQTARRERDAATQKDVELEIAQIEARIARIEAELGYFDVKSPIDGVIVEDAAKDLIGARLSMGEKLMRISSLGDLRLDAWVSAQDRTRVDVSAEATFSPDASPRDFADAVIQNISPATEERDGFIVFHVDLGFLGDAAGLREGMAGVLAVDHRRKIVGLLVFHRIRDWLGRFFWL